MRMSRKQTPISTQYELKDAKYLGVTVGDDLEWTKHINAITTKANSKLSFLRRNLKGCPEKLGKTAYFALVRSFLKYSATVWHPHQKYNSDKLEMVQRRAARFMKGRYGMYESVTQMFEELSWVPLSKRRENARLSLFYKIINNLAMVPHSCLEKADGRTRKSEDLQGAFSRFQGVNDVHFNTNFKLHTFTRTYINRHPWMTEALRTQIRLKNSKYKEYVKSNNVDIVESYKDSKRILHSSLRNAEIQYYSEQYELNSGDMLL